MVIVYIWRSLMLRNKHLRLDQSKIDRARRILKADTETEALHVALDTLIEIDRRKSQRRKLLKAIQKLRRSLARMPEDTSDWIRQAREERDPGR
jgi:hypothetical protein